MEDGRISLDVFQSFQREMTATEAQYVERLQIQNAAAWAQAAATYNSYLQTQALQAQAWRTAQPIHCVSNRTGAFVNTTCY
jgi:hypothetical protein